jgi:hypothetical protein
MNRTVFFQSVRMTLFGGRLSVAEVAGLSAILDRARVEPGGCDLRWLAYMLATAHHETGRKMQPVRETGAASDEQAIARLERAYARGLLPSVRAPYWRRDVEGKTWLGRGLVQLTHKRNYERMSRLIGEDLVFDPDRALDSAIAVSVLFAGMTKGAFSGVALGDVFTPDRTDWIGARRIVNGRDHAEDIASYARAYHAALLGRTCGQMAGSGRDGSRSLTISTAKTASKQPGKRILPS